MSCLCVLPVWQDTQRLTPALSSVDRGQRRQQAKVLRSCEEIF